MRFFTKPDGSIRWLVVASLFQLAIVAVDLFVFREPLRPSTWGRLSVVVVMLAFVPLDEPGRRERGWREHLRTPRGWIAAGAVLLWMAINVWAIGTR